MTRHGARAALFVAALLPALAAAADDVTLDGDFVQGGLVQGWAPPGSIVTLDDRAVGLSADGRFLIGFGREAPPRAVLRVHRPDGGGATERTLAVGQRDYRVQRIDGLPKSTVSPDPDELARMRAEIDELKRTRDRYSGRTDYAAGFAWPAIGPITGVYGSQRILNGEPRRPHFGVDVAAPEGTPVTAPADGVVTLRHDGMLLTGKTLTIDHGQGLTSVLIHMSEITAATGQRVKRGEMVGRIGATGRATGPHLHWGVYLLTTPLDPALLVPPMPEG